MKQFFETLFHYTCRTSNDYLWLVLQHVDQHYACTVLLKYFAYITIQSQKFAQCFSDFLQLTFSIENVIKGPLNDCLK